MQFIYRAMDSAGQEKTGVIEADGQEQAASDIAARGFFLIEIKEKKSSGTGKQRSGDILQSLLKTPPSKVEVLFFTRQFCAMMSAGVPILKSLNTVTGMVKNEKLQEILTDVGDQIKNGSDFSEALSKYPKTFNKMYTSIVKVGEASGKLDKVMYDIIDIEQKMMDIMNKVKSAMTYPVVILCLAVGVVGFVVTSILPKFVKIFAGMGAKLPKSTVALVAIGDFLRGNFTLVSVGLAAAVIGFIKFKKTETGKHILDKIMLKIPVAGEMVLKIHVSRFARTLSGLIGSGIPLNRGLEITVEAEQNYVIKSALEQVRVAIVGGTSLAQALQDAGIFPDVVIQMVAAGEISGNLDKMTLDVGDYLDSEVDQAIKMITTLIEPLLLVSMGVVIAFLALSILLPVLGVVKAFKH
ncbi:MAG: type II secretion system F family protein [Candidatus Omnitrophica bacterium]|nr:type II secretion system F family protein [Candidatus Omnitrophota bacterium]MDD5488543.1 type II secretion system F family protein [Candidatus Omnitrophota bacterium]